MDIYIRGPSNYNPNGEASVVSNIWKEGVEKFDAFVDSKSISNLPGDDNADKRAQRKALLLYHAGHGVREIYKTLTATARDEYTATVNALNAHFTVETNVTFQRHLFRKMTQNENETVAQFCARLRKAGTNCGYVDNLDDQIRDQIVETCSSTHLRRKLLEQGNDLTLAKLLAIAVTYEMVEARAKEMNSNATVNRTSNAKGAGNTKCESKGKKPQSTQQSANGDSKKSCGRCGKSHKPRECPAFGKVCHKCKGKNHFKIMCRSKPQHAQVVTEGSTSSPNPPDLMTSFAFCNYANKVGLQRTSLQVGGVPVRFVIDTGADCNIIGQNTWEEMKTFNVSVNRQERGGPKIFPYTQNTPFDVVGQFWANVENQNTSSSLTNVKFVVIENNAEPLLGIETATQLNLVQFINRTEVDYATKFPKLFSGEIGMAEREVKLSIDKDVNPVAQPYRRVPFAMMDKLEAHLNELVEQDIIEKVDGPTTWVSPVVIVPKSEGKIRLCVDMRQANRAIQRHHYPVPTVDELLRDMNGAQYFSKIDLKLGFHQFVLSPESRDITTFNTHVGVYRYKRLMFGINAAPELYQREVADIIRGLAGVANLADDIVIHGKTKSEHDQRLFDTLTRLEKAGMTLNRAKCVFGSRSIDFLGQTEE